MNYPQHHHPPSWPLRFLRWVIKPDYLEEIEGDMEEVYHGFLEEYSPAKSQRLYVLETIKLLRFSLIRPLLPNHIHVQTGMLKHNFLITYRSFLRNKSTFLINLVGLSTGLACILFIYFWVKGELSVDTFHDNGSQLYQVLNNYHGTEGIQTWENSPMPLANALMEDFPEVEMAAFTSHAFGDGKLVSGEKSQEADRMLASERFFEVFSHDLIQGDPQHVLADKNNIVISQELAIKLFRTTSNVIGKTVEWKHPHREWINRTYTVSGIFSSPPKNSTQQFDALVHYELLGELDRYSKEWTSTSGQTFAVLKKGTDVDQFNEKIKNYRQEKDPRTKGNTLYAQQFSAKYLHGRYENGMPVGGRIEYIRYFSLLAIIILLIACINFMNLSTAQASRKMKEIGVKKTVGASRKALVFQFLIESVSIVMLSAIAALMLVSFFKPNFNQIIGKSLDTQINLEVSLGIGLIILITGILAGSYPAFYLSGFKPINVLKKKRIFSGHEQWIRKGLVIFQFALSAIFIAGVLVVNRQMEYLNNKYLGFDRDHIISFQRPNHTTDPQPFLTELKNVIGIENAGVMQGSIFDGYSDQSGYSWSGQESERNIVFKSPQIGNNVIETLDMKLLEGRSFSREYSNEHTKVVINQSAQKLMGLTQPIGHVLQYATESEREIVGVVEDFHYGSLHQEIEPLIFRFPDWGWGTNTLVKIQAGSEKASLEKIENVYKAFYPETPFQFSFLDEEYQQLYESESRVAILSQYVCGLAILISCLGLLGLVAFKIERRQKELGIRKVLGASVYQLMKLLSSDFTRMIGLAILIAFPVSYFITQDWLSSFAYKIDLQWSFFVIAALITFAIAWLTVGFQTLKAAHLNPVEFLRDE